MKIYCSEMNYPVERRKAKLGDRDAMVRVAFYILNGNLKEQFSKREVKRAIRYYMKAAKRGDKSAMLDLAACYMEGKGVERNHREAVKWYNRGYEPNNPSSCYCLGWLNLYDYLEDKSEIVTTDPVRVRRALYYFQKGADLESSDCLYELGVIFLSGKGVEKDSRKAFRFFRKAEQLSDPEILNDRLLHIYLRLAECCHYGIGTSINLDKAFYWICLFRDEFHRRSRYREEESFQIIEEGEKEWKAINIDIDESLQRELLGKQ